VGTMGKRRGRRTRSDEGGHRRDLEDGWPTFQHNQWTFEGYLERWSAFHRGLGRIRERGGRRAIPTRDLLVPIVVTLALLVAVSALLVALLVVAT
jgi:hypothetical protein